MIRPVLAPGLRVLRRSRDELQVGLGTTRACVPDTEPVRRTLDTLLRGEAVPDDPASRVVLRSLAPVLVDGSGLLASGVAPGDVAALALRDPAGYRALLDARRRATVAVIGTLGPAAADPRPLLSAAGVRVSEPSPGDLSTAALVLSVGEVDRARLDPLLRAGVPHLVVRLVEGTALVGPFVAPGRTACLRCLDAHRAVDDPRAADLAAQHSHADRHDGVAEPVDTALAVLAVAWAVRDLVTYVEGGRPATWSSTVEVAPTLAPVIRAEWRRHPGCGCAWLPDQGTSSTMGV